LEQRGGWGETTLGSMPQDSNRLGIGEGVAKGMLKSMLRRLKRLGTSSERGN